MSRTIGVIRNAAVALALSLAFLVGQPAPPVAMACSCAGPFPLADYVREPENVILTGRGAEVEAALARLRPVAAGVTTRRS